jgi:hypothetical protein
VPASTHLFVEEMLDAYEVGRLMIESLFWIVVKELKKCF